jgi:hypothetical protein
MDKSFVFEKRQKHFANICFLAEAVSTDTTRPFINVLHVEVDSGNKILTATDGRRLHQLTIPIEELEIEEGYYTVIKKADIITLTKTGQVQFPNWRCVIPENTVNLYEKMLINKKRMEHTAYMLNRLDIMISIDYLSSLDGLIWNCRQDIGGRRKAVIFESGERKAVIMPLQPDYESEIEAAQKRLNTSQEKPINTVKPVELAKDTRPVARQTKNRELRMDSRWKSNRLGTRQTMVCRF